MFRIESICAVVLMALAARSGFGAAPLATPLSASPGAPRASSFPGPLWQVSTPNGGSAWVSNSHLFVKVPGGSNHDALLPSNQAVRVVQPVGDVPFDVTMKIDSPVLAANADTHQGIMVLTDDANFLTFSLGANGTNVTLTAQVVAQGKASTVFEDATFREYQSPMYLRIARNQAAYLAYYSVDGVVWRQAASFTDSRTPAWVGPFASNYNPNPSRAVPVVMAVNWFTVL
jgi:hypothetical protein